MPSQLNKFDQLKRRIYIWAVPVMIFALLINFLELDNTPFNYTIAALLIIWFVMAWILIIKKVLFRYVETFTLILLCCLHLLKVFEVVHVEMGNHHEITTGNGSFWTPLLFIYITVTLNGRIRSALFSISIWILTWVFAISNWQILLPEAHTSIAQYQLSNLVYIIFLFFARQIFLSYSESELLKELAYQDPLTGIHNRRSAFKLLNNLVKKGGKPFSIIFFDIDHFKQINDKFGHGVGDDALKGIASLIETLLDREDTFGRLGGEEFLIITPKQDLTDALKKAEELRVLIETHDFPVVGSITSSFGVTTFDEGDSVETLISRADEALYLAKEEGRNQIKSVVSR